MPSLILKNLKNMFMYNFGLSIITVYVLICLDLIFGRAETGKRPGAVTNSARR